MQRNPYHLRYPYRSQGTNRGHLWFPSIVSLFYPGGKSYEVVQVSRSAGRAADGGHRRRCRRSRQLLRAAVLLGRHSHNEGHYYYRHYYYKPSPTYTGYRHHYVIYYPTRPKYYYYYNPYKKVYWGRCPVDYNGEEQYSMLARKIAKAI